MNHDSITEWRRRARISQEYSMDRRNVRETASRGYVFLGFLAIFCFLATLMILVYFFTGWLYSA